MSDANFDYRLYLLEKIRRGEASLKRGGIAHAEVRKRAARWRRKRRRKSHKQD